MVSRVTPLRYDLAIVGAGIIGLAHAALARERGMSVVVVERYDRAVGASVRNFGHIGVTTQEDEALVHARAGREHWLRLAAQAGFWIQPAGTLILARAEDERAIIEEFAAQRDGSVRVLDARGVREIASIADPRLLGGALCEDDLRVSSVEAIPAIASYLAASGVDFHFRTNVTGASTGVLHTSRGDIEASTIVVAAGHDTDMLFPRLAEEANIQRCLLHMLEVDAPPGSRFSPVILTGTAVLRYRGLSQRAAAQSIRDRLARDHPDLLAALVNVKMSQRPNGRLVLGDTHAYAHTHDPFRDEELDDLLLREFHALLGAPLRVRRRWHGEYAHSETEDYFVREPVPGVFLACVTNGTGMSTGLGFARSVLDRVG